MREPQELSASPALEWHKTYLSSLKPRLSFLLSQLRAPSGTLIYNIQIGEQAGTEAEYAIQTKVAKSHRTTTNTFLLNYLFDRPIGRIYIETTNAIPAHQNSIINDFIENICLNTAAIREQYASSLIGDTVTSTVAHDSNRRNYNELARQFRTALSASGFVIWRLCNDKRLADGSFELAELPKRNNGLPHTSFLHALGSSPPTVQIDMGIDEGVASHCLRQGKSLRIDNLEDKTEVAQKTDGSQIAHPEVVKDQEWHSGVFIPIRSQDSFVGVVGAYSRRPHGFNNLDERLAQRCADHISTVFRVHAADQKNGLLIEKIADLGMEVASAQYTVIGSVHDAVNISKGLKDHIDYVIPTTNTETYFNLVKGFVEQNATVLGKIRDNIRNPKSLPKNIKLHQLEPFVIQKTETLRVEAQLKKIHLEVKISPDIYAEIDDFRMSIVLFNIIQNAIRHFSKVHRIKKQITIRAEPANNNVAMTIHDNGSGVNPEIKDRIFEPFVTTSLGMGLGLYIAETFLKEMNGDIKVESRWGDYTQFLIRIPAKKND